MSEAAWDLLENSRQLRYHQRIQPLREVVRLADESEDERLRFWARSELMSACCFGGAVGEVFGLFAWLLQRYEASPEWFGDQERHNVLWTYKWMVTNLIDFPQVSLDQLNRTLADLESHYLAAGEGLEPVRNCAYSLASHIRGRLGAQPEFEAWQELGRTPLSDCSVCQTNQVINHLVAQGRFAEAITAATPALGGDVRCSEHPETMQANLLLPLLETGRQAEAAQYHLASWRRARNNPSELGIAATHIEICARSGALTRGVELAEEALGIGEPYESPWVEMRLAAAIARLGADCQDAGLGDQVIRTAAGPTAIAALAAERRQRALDLAAQFDQRNGTDAVSRSVHETLTAPKLPDLQLGVLGAAAEPEIDWHQPAEHPEAPELAEIDQLDETGLAERWRAGRRWGSEAVLTAVVDSWLHRRPAALAKAATDQDVDRAALAELEFALGRRQADRVLSGHQATFASAAELHRAAGAEAEAALVELTAATLANDFTTASDRLDWILANGDLTQQGHALARWLRAALSGHADWARRVDQLRTLPIDLTAAAEAREAMARGLTYAAWREEPAELLRWLETARQLLPDDEFPDAKVMMLSRTAHALHALGRGPEAVEAEAAALRLASSARLAQSYAGALVSQALSAEETGEPAEAERLLNRAVRISDTLPDLQPRSLARLRLASLLHGTGRPLQAAEIGEAGLATLGEAAHGPTASNELKAVTGQLIVVVSDALLALGEQDRALALSERALPLFEATDNRTMLAATHHQRSLLLSPNDPAAALRELDRSIELGTQLASWRLVLVSKRERYWLVQRLDGIDAALVAHDDSLATLSKVEALVLADRDAHPDLQGWDFEAELLTQQIDRARLLGQGNESEKLAGLACLADLPERLLAARGPETYVLSAFDLRATLQLLTGDETAGLETLAYAADLAQQTGNEYWQHLAARGAQWLDAQGRQEQARQFWGRFAGKG